jgi:hypothetical protein
MILSLDVLPYIYIFSLLLSLPVSFLLVFLADSIKTLDLGLSLLFYSAMFVVARVRNVTNT